MARTYLGHTQTAANADLDALAAGTAAGWIQGGSGAVERSVSAKLRERLTPFDFGAVGDGVTNDAVALAAALVAAQAAGRPLEIPRGFTFACSSWSTVTTTAALTVIGNGTILYTGSTQAMLLTVGDDIVIDGVTFDGWRRVISNPTGTAGSLEWVRVTNCRFLNAADTPTISSNFCQQVLLQNPVQNVLIADNFFENGLYAAFEIGDNVYADQDDWEKIVVRNNRISGIAMSGATPGIGYGFLIYGRDAVIDGNDIEGVEGQIVTSSTSNGASGIYTKCRWARIVNNAVRNIGLVTDPSTERGGVVGIHVKGSDRAGTASPQGYNTIVTNNTVQDIGAANVKGYGIALQHSDVICHGNIVEEAGRIAISYADQASAVGSTVISENLILQATGAAFTGIDVVPLLSKTVVRGNIVNCPNNCILVRTVSGNGANVTVQGNITKTGIGLIFGADSFTLTNISVSDNVLQSGAYGCYFGTSGGGTFSDVMVTDNDYSAASTLAINGTGAAIPSGARIRNNRGYRSENGATSSAISTGGTIAHGLAATPTTFSATPTSAATDVTVTADATNLTVTFGGGGSVAFAWRAEISNVYVA